MAEQAYDVVVLGAGPAGENVAARVVQHGLTAALVESELLGGECSYWACMPSKALLRSGEALRAARAVPGAAEAVKGSLDVAATLRRRDGLVAQWDDSGQVAWAEGAGVTVVRGRGTLAGPRRVAVLPPDATPGAEPLAELTARHAVVVCTGSVPQFPPVAGLREARPWTSRDATAAKQPPERLAVLGGGVVGCELAQAWSDLGSEVTVLQRSEQLLPRFEPFAGDLVAHSLRARGVTVHTGTTVRSVSRDGDGPTTLTHDGGEIAADAVLVATGRVPRTGDLGLDTVGLDTEPGAGLAVDDSCRVRAVDEGWLYAAGDVNGRALLTHMGKYQARACADAIAARAAGRESEPTPWSPRAASADHTAVTSVVFTDPQVASVGRTEQRARDDGLRVRAVEYDVGSVAGAALRADGYGGRAKLVVDEDRRVVVGCTVVAPDAGELLHAATVAVVGEVPLDRLWHAVPAFPTVSELWLRLLETYGL